MIQTAVMSAWSAGGRFATNEADARMWALSLHYLRQQFDNVVLHADMDSYNWLIRWLDLPFTDTRQLEIPNPRHPGIFGLGKLHTYRAQTGPFIHVDYDVFIRKPLPDRILQAPLLAQSKEMWRRGDGSSRDKGYAPSFASLPNLPAAWRSALSESQQSAYNTGIFGGHDLPRIRAYVDQSLGVLEDPANQDALKKVHGTVAILHLEQYALAADNLPITCLFPRDPVEKPAADAAGYTHLLGESKWDPSWIAKVRAALHREDPELSSRIDKLYANR